MFSDRESESPDFASEGMVFGMRVGEQIGVFRGELSATVQQTVRDGDGDDFRQEHVMGSEGDGFDDFAFDVERTVRDDRAFDLCGGERRKPRLREFIDVAAGFHAAPVCDFRLRDGRDVDDEFLRAGDDFVGVTVLSDGDRQHGGIGTDGSCPGDGDDVGGVGGFAAAAGYEHDRYGH